MLRVGVFSDDLGGPLAAIMLAHGLAVLGHPVTVAGSTVFGIQPRFEDAIGTRRIETIALDEGSEADGLDTASQEDRDVIAFLPLSALREGAIMGRIDLSIVVGKSHPAAARALRAARCEPSRAGTTPWFLAFSTQSVLRTEAGLMTVGSIPLPYATRALPTTLPRLDHSREECILQGAFPEECLRTGILLAALATAAAVLPESIRIEASDLTALMEADATASERQASRRLTALANAYERVVPSGEPKTTQPPMVTARRRDAERWHPARAVTNPANGRPAVAWIRKPT